MLPVDRSDATAKDATAKDPAHATADTRTTLVPAMVSANVMVPMSTTGAAGASTGFSPETQARTLALVSAMVSTNALVPMSAAGATGASSGFSPDSKSRSLALMYELFEEERNRKGRPVLGTDPHVVLPCAPRRSGRGGPREPATGVDEVPCGGPAAATTATD
jgi:hypothetical protein